MIETVWLNNFQECWVISSETVELAYPNEVIYEQAHG